jgi:hypothetical protein
MDYENWKCGTILSVACWNSAAAPTVASLASEDFVVRMRDSDRRRLGMGNSNVSHVYLSPVSSFVPLFISREYLCASIKRK